jgi:hypothetical protein
MRRKFRTPSPALVISLVALFVALGGTTYAATSLPKNSVGSAQLKKGAVTKAKINKKAIRALKGNRGRTGANGVSVTSTALASGNANCATGGSSFASASGTTYACNGAKGDQGPPGPTAGATSAGQDPSASPATVLTSPPVTMTTTTSSSLLVTGWGTMDLNCGAAACTDDWGLYVDGAPVPGTEWELSANTSSSTSGFMLISGITGSLPAGTHTVVFKDNTTGPWSSLGYQNAKVTVVALGAGASASVRTNQRGAAPQSAHVSR